MQLFVPVLMLVSALTAMQLTQWFGMVVCHGCSSPASRGWVWGSAAAYQANDSWVAARRGCPWSGDDADAKVLQYP